MESSGSLEVTRLLSRMQQGEERAADELLVLLFDELRALAERLMRDQRAGHTLQTTALLNEAWLRLAGAGGAYEGRRHFLRVAASAMRSVLVDHARRKRAGKRGGGGGRVPLDGIDGIAALDGGVALDGVAALYEQRAVDLLALDEALGRLGEVDEQLLRVVELRFFGGLENAEVAEVLGVSTRTVERGWRTARAWLGDALGAPGD